MSRHDDSFHREQDHPVSAKSKVFRQNLERTRTPGIDILKLHGSLNWVSRHVSSAPTPKALMNPTRQLWVSPRKDVLNSMMMNTGQRRMYTFPVVVPPVINKASIFHSSLLPIWRLAHLALKTADRIIVYGYSCPQADQESANLLARGIRANSKLHSIHIIDPNPMVVPRFAELSNANQINYYTSAQAYLDSV